MNNERIVVLTDELLDRKGARKMSEIPHEVIELLQKGQLQTVNLTEWLAVDHVTLLQHVLDELGLAEESSPIIRRVSNLADKKVMKIIPAIALEWKVLLDSRSVGDSSTELYKSELYVTLAQHHSDSVRCWAAYIIGQDQRMSVHDKLVNIRPFAADSHFGVREIAWMALREDIINNLIEFIHYLSDWVHDEDANIRRYAIELTRPQGVWAKHIIALKENPQLALPLIESVLSDPAKYVQDSVSNWLNDASKTNPEWVKQICQQWLKISDTKETKRIVTRGQRSLAK
ncbi:MAG: DNA alkylation repair protein [Candidatus Pristimantibacillus lignocellulolyticus]|uniref:DNA alkylation repair protein n=1 Tax=Candidatus Pristimantibacillus lignocellulolyticus TaxID=2994561 RepID=A0A9J6ZBB9_9BACL|nr:MAG: DNA alkylation repair protein [Candidatus Pristimantibacillus lignocellulolyticus]